MRRHFLPGLVLLVLLLPACSGGGTNPVDPDLLAELRRGLSVSRVDPYAQGPYPVEILTSQVAFIDSDNEQKILDTRVFSPSTPGRYAVVQFQHGFVLDVDFFRVILGRLAEHGFIVVAAQMYEPGSVNSGSAPTIPRETEWAIEVNDWIREQINTLGLLRADVIAVSGLLGISGHSRGGQVAWRVLREQDWRALSVAGVDPVDSGGPPFGPADPYITAEPFNLNQPSLSLGTGLGGEEQFGQSCAPVDRNYSQFYNAARSPAWETVALEYGHNDMLDDDCFQNNQPECSACAQTQTGTRAEMRTFTAGQLVAFYRQTLQGISAGSALTQTNIPNEDLSTRSK